MKKTITSLLAAGLLATTGTALAADYMALGYINAIRTSDGQLFIDFSIEESSGDRPACHTNEQWDFRTDGFASPLLKETLVTLSDNRGGFELESSGDCAGSVQTIRAVRFFRGGMR